MIPKSASTQATKFVEFLYWLDQLKAKREKCLYTETRDREKLPATTINEVYFEQQLGTTRPRKTEPGSRPRICREVSVKQMEPCILEEKLILEREQQQPASSLKLWDEMVDEDHVLVLSECEGLATTTLCRLPCCRSLFRVRSIGQGTITKRGFKNTIIFSKVAILPLNLYKNFQTTLGIKIH